MFACYVSKVFLEEEDSCKYVAPLGSGKARPQATPRLQHPGQGPAWPGWEGALGRPLSEWGGEEPGVGGIYMVSPFWTEVRMSRCPVHGPSTTTLPAPLRPCPLEGLHKAGPYLAPPIPSVFPQPRLLP